MPSKESEVLIRLYDDWAAQIAAHPEWTLVDLRSVLEHWGDVSTEPRGVDYIETTAGGVPAMWAEPKASAQDRVLLAIHGGGYLAGSMYSHRKLFSHMAKAIGCRALILDYGLAPEHPFPAGLEDVLSAYRWLLDQGIDPKNIILTGDSAGGGLVLAVQFRIREKGMSQPCASVLLSAWTDLEGAGRSVTANAQSDRLVTTHVMESNRTTYLSGGGNPSDPHASPIHGDFSGLPPMYFQVGGDELILDDSRLAAELAEQAGVEVKIDVYPGMQHVFQFLVGNAPEADNAIGEIARWVRPRLGL